MQQQKSRIDRTEEHTQRCVRRKRWRYIEKTFCGAPRACRAPRMVREKHSSSSGRATRFPTQVENSGKGIVGASGVEEHSDT